MERAPVSGANHSCSACAGVNSHYLARYCWEAGRSGTVLGTELLLIVPAVILGLFHVQLCAGWPLGFSLLGCVEPHDGLLRLCFTGRFRNSCGLGV